MPRRDLAAGRYEMFAFRMSPDGPAASGDDVPNDSSTTASVVVGGPAVLSSIDGVNDTDWFAVSLVAGQSYAFSVVGTGGAPLVDPILYVYNGPGNYISIDDDGGDGVNAMMHFTATQTRTYYLAVGSSDATSVGSYEISAVVGPPQDPLDTLDLGFSFHTNAINVYLATTGEQYGPLAAAVRSWTPAELVALVSALETISAVADLSFTIVNTQAEADLTLTLAQLPLGVLGAAFPNSIDGYIVFDPDAPGWSNTGLQPGGLGYSVIIHEVLHTLGLDHPHYDGFDTQVMQGVVAPFGSFGTFELNQQQFTIMSYNDGTPPSFDWGYSAAPMALDIAFLQALYGANASRNAGDSTYQLSDANAGARYVAIYDTAGTDAITYVGSRDVVIDLRDATLLSEIGGGGYVSGADSIYGGFTIAHGVVIENATAGAGYDVITGNDVANVLNGSGGDNILSGGAGDDTLITEGGGDLLDGGAGNDAMYGGDGDDTYFVDVSGDVVVEEANSGNDQVWVSNIHTYIVPENVERINADVGVYAVIGNGLNNIIGTTAFSDASPHYFDGGAGADTYYGGSANDHFVVDDVGDRIIDYAGYNVVESYLINTYFDNVSEIILRGAALNALGDHDAEIFRGNANNNSINGRGGLDFIYGEDGDDTLTGGFAADFLDGGAHNDTLSGGDSADTLYGRSGNDQLNGDGGADSMYGGAGDDTYVVDAVGDMVTENASEGTDTVQSSIAYTLGANVENLTLQGADPLSGTGNELANAITGNDGNNLLTGNGGGDTLDGGEGDDALLGGAGADVLIGGNGNDTATYWNASAGVIVNLVTGGTGGDAAGDTFDGIERVEGSAHDDTLIGNALANTLLGGAGSDTLDGGAGGDLMVGNAGDDIYHVDSLNDGTFEGLAGAAGGNDTVRSVIGWTIATNIENLILLGTADWGVGNTLANTLTGNASNNQFYGLDGDDIIDGGAGADLMIGHLGNDTYYVDNAGDNPYEGNAAWGADTVIASIGWTLGVNLENLLLTGTAGNFGTGNSLNNTITGNSGNNQLYGLEGDDILIGGAGADLMIGHQGNDNYYVDNAGDNPYEGNPAWGIDTVVTSLGWTLGANLENLTLHDAAGGTFATGNSLDNTIIGNASNNQLYGLEGNDILNGGAGADLMIGYTGNDTYYVDNAGDNPYEGNAAWGIDTVISSLGWTLGANLENLTLAEAAGATFATGNSLDNTIIGNTSNNQLYGLGGNDVLNGGAGADLMIGHGGNDTYIVDNVGDTVFEGLSGAPGGTDEVRSSINYTLGANVENLVLTGTATTGVANALNNRITGNASANTLIGDAGADTFVFASAVDGSNIDALTDFNVADDTIELSTSIFTGIGLGVLSANAFVIGSAAADGDDRIIYNSATGALYYDADGDGAGAAIQIATLGTGLALTENDFLGGP